MARERPLDRQADRLLIDAASQSQSAHHLQQGDVVVSRYVSNPLLIDGFKFDLRLYSGDLLRPLRCTHVRGGPRRTLQALPGQPGGAFLKNLFMHLTNYSINKHSAHFVNNADRQPTITTSSLSPPAALPLAQRCQRRQPLPRRLSSLSPLDGVTSIRGHAAAHCTLRSSFGFDVLIDDASHGWQVGLAPSLAVVPLDLKVRAHALPAVTSPTSAVRRGHRVRGGDAMDTGTAPKRDRLTLPRTESRTQPRPQTHSPSGSRGGAGGETGIAVPAHPTLRWRCRPSTGGRRDGQGTPRRARPPAGPECTATCPAMWAHERQPRCSSMCFVSGCRAQPARPTTSRRCAAVDEAPTQPAPPPRSQWTPSQMLSPSKP